MSKSYRIRTTPGEDNGYLKVNIDLSQNYDHLEILSLKISQIDEYQNYCSDYGVIAGRVDINNGFGVPNVKVSVFVPVEELDLDDPVISKLYPYEDPFPDKKNINGIRYNVLPKNKQTLDHTPVGTFPKKREILDDATTLEIYEKYYKFTTTTNKSGDYILFGVPLGDHYLHYDCDVSDIGFISSRPYEMMSEGYSEDLFDNRYKFKSSNNLDSLAQIFSQNIPITVEPFWCDSLSVGSPLGINRQDISIEYEVTPTAIFMGSIFSDDEKDSLNKNCKPDRQMGQMNEVITGSGKIEALRRNIDGGIEKFNFKDNAIDDNGNWSVLVPMNIRKVVTDEFGNLVPSPDGIAGIATEGDYRFRMSMDATGNDKRLRQRAKFLVPNTNNNFNFDEYSQEELKNSTDFTINDQLSTITSGTTYDGDLTNQYNYLEEFYPFRWKKVYTVKQYIGRMQKWGGTPKFLSGVLEPLPLDEARGFIGIKDIVNSEGVNKFPNSRFDTNIHPIYTIICTIVTFFGIIVGFINGITNIINGLVTMICDIKLPVGICGYSLKGGQFKFPYKKEIYNGSTYIPFSIVGTATLTTKKCYDAKGICDDVQAVVGCGGDLKECYEQAFWESSNLNTPPNHEFSEFFDPFVSSPVIPCSSQSNTLTGPWDAPYSIYTLNPNDPQQSREIRTHLSYHAFGGAGCLAGACAGCCMFYWGGFCYSSEQCLTTTQNPTGIFPPPTIPTFCQRVRMYDDNEGFQADIDYCQKCSLSSPNINCAPTNTNAEPDATEKGNGCCKGELKLLGTCWSLKYKCLFGQLLCKKCKTHCPEIQEHSCCKCHAYKCEKPGCDKSCCNKSSCGAAERCCEHCCVKIPLIPLKCAEENLDLRITLIKTPFASDKCNDPYVKLFDCKSCGGPQTPGIKDWVSCLLEPVAVFLRMLKFDFYNDWVGGSLYFPLIKRKYKLKKSKRKFGQIKKDKFCDFECRDKETNDQFQGNPTFNQWRIKINATPFSNPSITVDGCTAKSKSRRVTDWYGTQENDDQTDNLNLAVKELTFPGTNANGDGCVIEFATWLDFQTTFTSYGISYTDQSKEVQTTHGKPEYVETEDAAGNSTWKNIGGHAHHRNTCDNTRMVERNEYFKTSLDCWGVLDTPFPSFPAGELVEEPDPEAENDIVSIDDVNCPDWGCKPNCGTNGVAPCKNNPDEQIKHYNEQVIRHGLISWHDENIYYTPYIPPDDSKHNSSEYKGNLLLPTTILELGSSVYCDIDDVPFIMDKLEPTTFRVSLEDTKYRSVLELTNYDPGTPTDITDDGTLRKFTKYEDKKNSSLNLRAYVEFSCISVVCCNTVASVNQSQIGVDMIDKNDIGVEIGNCFLRFEHDDDIRDYFCRRFNGYEANDLSFHHTRPGSREFDNNYQTYPEITLTDGDNLYYQFPPPPNPPEIVKSEYNDGDPFIPGDACGYYNRTKTQTDYFYGLAPGQTSSFINYPNSDPAGSANGTIVFGQTAHPDNIDEIFNPNSDFVFATDQDDNNGSTYINGIRFNRSQTPYYLYFGLVPGKTALHRTVGKFFADKINAVTLEGVGGSNNDVSQNINNKPNVNNEEENPFTVFRTCLGDTLIEKIQVT
jgi:hypothetical protein